MSTDPIVTLLENVNKQAAVISRTEHVLEREILGETSNVIETEKGKYRVLKKIEKVVTETIIVREFDPELNYEDQLEEFSVKTDERMQDFSDV